MAQTDPTDPEAKTDFVGDEHEENPPAKTSGEEDHEDPWQYADLTGPSDPLPNSAPPKEQE